MELSEIFGRAPGVWEKCIKQVHHRGFSLATHRRRFHLTRLAGFLRPKNSNRQFTQTNKFPTMMASVSLSNPRAARRKMALLQQGGLFTGDTKGATIRRAFTAEDLRKAYALVHDVFLGTGYMKPEPSGIRLRMFETLPETATFVAEVDGNVVGVLSVVGDTPD